MYHHKTGELVVHAVDSFFLPHDNLEADEQRIKASVAALVKNLEKHGLPVNSLICHAHIGLQTTLSDLKKLSHRAILEAFKSKN